MLGGKIVFNAGHRAIIAAIAQHNPMLAEAETVKHLAYISEKMNYLREKTDTAKDSES